MIKNRIINYIHKKFNLLNNHLSYSTFTHLHESFDYIIVGGGSAGCILANRLSLTSEKYKVLLMEAGPFDKYKWDSWKIEMPAALTYNLGNNKYNWYYFTKPQIHLNNRILPWPRGRVLGGSSSLNAMVYIRGHAYDYNNWEKLGAKGWTYQDVLPYFKKAQNHSLGENEYRGGNGPLYVTRGSQLKKQELFNVFIKAGIEAGYPFTEDLNGYQQEGFGLMDMTIYKGKRMSTSAAYIHPLLNKNNSNNINLTVKTNCIVNKILFDKKKAIGIEYSSYKPNRQNAIKNKIYANKEVILCGGAINSPQLLMLSGIGNADHLRQKNITNIVQHLPGVGQNLEDHLDLYIQFECLKPITLHNATWKYPMNMVKIGLEWFLNKSGMGSSAHLESGGFIRSNVGVEYPDIQYHFLPGALTGQLTPGSCHAMQAHCSPMRASSRGEITLQSNNPYDAPIINPNYLSTKKDIEDIREGVKLTLEIFKQKAFDEYRGKPISPNNMNMTENEIDAFVRKNTESAYHPCCTNKMGNENDIYAVTDYNTKVYGVDNLRVVDASIMPSIISGNLNAPTIMIAEKAADIILGKKPLKKTNVPIYEAKDWKTKQR